MDRPQLLPRSTPAAEGIAPSGITALLDRLDARSVECHSLMVVRHGRVVAEGWWAPYSASRPHLLYSLTKTFTGAAAGIAIGDGLLSLDTRLGDVLPAYDSSLTVEHLLTMTAGHADDSLAEAWTLSPGDLIDGFLRVPFPYPAGTRHAYDNATTFVLARIVEQVTGRGLPEFLDERLFGPMGISGAEWDRVASGKSFGFHGLHLTTEAVAAFGELLLRNGRWHDRQLIPRDFLAAATTRRIETLQFEDGSRDTDCLQGYGYQLWMSRHGYRGDGAFGQFCLVIPSHDLVVAMTSAMPHTQAALEAVWDCLLPAVDAGVAPDGPSPAARLRQLSLPLVAGEHRPERSVRASIPSWGTSVMLEPRPGGWLLRLENLPEPAKAEALFDTSAGASVDVSPGASAGASASAAAGASAGASVGASVELGVGHHTWRESSPLGRPLVATGGWQGDVFVADLYIITGPHRLRLTIDGPLATATWNLIPLTGPNLLNQLRSPLMTRPDVS
ncbi:serine hydrolase domain-containing protein [Actinoplanes sp. NPDC051411]|uniref:serine hydrolase domain-containing protein n=1 Tax=Actinoplanes sp. NPDC051411 TaxID=3155522 RepID=UPI003444ADC2